MSCGHASPAGPAERQVYLLLRSGEPLLDVDGQFPSGDPFPCLGHVVEGSPAVSGPAKKKKRDRGRNVVEGDPSLETDGA